jgi:hypothetical protein
MTCRWQEHGRTITDLQAAGIVDLINRNIRAAAFEPLTLPLRPVGGAAKKTLIGSTLI